MFQRRPQYFNSWTIHFRTDFLYTSYKLHW